MSQQSFKDLLGIVGNPQFRPEDVRATNWAKIDKALAKSKVDDDEGEWIDDSDAGWRKMPITISVPFHSWAKSPGVHNFFVGDFHYRPLVSVIWEKLSNTKDHPHFHYDPFELLWNPSSQHSEDIHIQCELYNSPAFLDAHRELQESPREPRCDLPQVLLAMMFASDATHLTSFGTAKSFFFVDKKDASDTLWPCQDYRYVNTHTIKDTYPLPLVQNLIDQVKDAKVFTKFDIQWGYNNIHIRDGDQ